MMRTARSRDHQPQTANSGGSVPFILTARIALLGRATTILLVRLIGAMVLTATICVIVREMLRLPASIDMLIAFGVAAGWTAWIDGAGNESKPH